MSKERDNYTRKARPTVIWICNIGLLYNFFLYPVSCWLVKIFLPEIVPPPNIPINDLFVLIGGVLGLGGLRTYEKIKGKSGN